MKARSKGTGLLCVPDMTAAASTLCQGRQQAERALKALYGLWAEQHGARLESLEAVPRSGKNKQKELKEA